MNNNKPKPSGNKGLCPPAPNLNNVEKYIFINEQEVSIGDVIELSGVKVVVSTDLIEQNPDKFKLKREPLFITEDDVEMYIGDRYWFTCEHGSVLDCIVDIYWPLINSGNNCKRFSTKEAAEEYIRKNKIKILDDYEGKLFSNGGLLAANAFSWLKTNEPKLYWLKVLQLIADDLNDGWKPDFDFGDNPEIYSSLGSCDLKFKIVLSRGAFKVNSVCGQSDPTVYFRSRELCEKAIELMDDKLDYIYK